VGITAEITGNFCPCLVECSPYHFESFRSEPRAINVLTGSHVGPRNVLQLTTPIIKLERHRGVTMAEPVIELVAPRNLYLAKRQFGVRSSAVAF
jgi:hypothetical protein